MSSLPVDPKVHELPYLPYISRVSPLYLPQAEYPLFGHYSLFTHYWVTIGSLLWMVGDVSVAQANSNVSRLQQNLDMIHWNRQGIYTPYNSTSNPIYLAYNTLFTHSLLTHRFQSWALFGATC